MLDSISVQIMRESDAATIGSSVPSLELMRRAARGIYEITKTNHNWNGKIAIVVGSGNNGGDGFALAEILIDEGYTPVVVSVTDHYSDDSTFYMNNFLQKGGIIAEDFDGADIIVDCLLGTGFKGMPRGKYLDMIIKINTLRENGSYVVSADINSGLNGDTAEAFMAVKSDLTVTIGFLKNGLVMDLIRDKNTRYIKTIAVAEIGIELTQKENLVLEPGDYLQCETATDDYDRVWRVSEKIETLTIR